MKLARELGDTLTAVCAVTKGRSDARNMLAITQSRCKFTVARLEWLEENVTPDISVLQANEEVLEGTLRNNRGTVSVRVWLIWF